MSRKIKHDHLIITDSNQVSFAKVSPADFRKLSTSPQKFADQNPEMTLSPTNAEPNAIVQGEDYGSKESINITFRLRFGGLASHNLWPVIVPSNCSCIPLLPV